MSEVAGSPGPPPVCARRADLQPPPGPSPEGWRRLRQRSRSGSRGSVHDAQACTRPRSWPLQSSEIGMAGGRPTGHPRSRRVSPHDGHNHSSSAAHWSEFRNRSLIPSGKVRSAIMLSRESAPGVWIPRWHAPGRCRHDLGCGRPLDVLITSVVPRNSLKCLEPPSRPRLSAA